MREYGLIGYPLTHSFSKKYFTEKFDREKISDAVFYNFPIPSINDLKTVLQQHPSLLGFCITIPYKRETISFLDSYTTEVRQMNACNCVKISNGKLYGFNTDVAGFEKSFIKQLQPHHKKALILGTGGASSAVEFVLNRLNIFYRFVSRQKNAEKNIFDYTDLNEAVMNEYTIIINCTPLGTFPGADAAPQIPYQFITSQHYLFDLVYNPPETKFLSLGRGKGAIIQNGYEMLVLQAEENWKIWNS